MKNFQKILENYGLSPNESLVYLSMLETGHTSILNISKATEIKRSTTYLIVESLIEKDLIEVVIKGKKKLFLPINPEKIIDLMEQKKQELQDIIPILKEKYNKQSEKPKINFFEGKNAIRKIYKEALNSKRETLWYGSAKDMKEEFYDYYLKMIEIRKHNPNFNGLRDIVTNTKIDKEYAHVQNSYKDQKIEVRILPPNLYYMNTDNIIYDNKLVVLSIKKNFFAIVIESQDIINAYRAMFELAWRGAKK